MTITSFSSEVLTSFVLVSFLFDLFPDCPLPAFPEPPVPGFPDPEEPPVPPAPYPIIDIYYFLE